jgi:hypothetical protein
MNLKVRKVRNNYQIFWFVQFWALVKGTIVFNLNGQFKQAQTLSGLKPQVLSFAGFHMMYPGFP